MSCGACTACPSGKADVCHQSHGVCADGKPSRCAGHGDPCVAGVGHLAGGLVACYARVAVARTSGGFTVSTNTVALVANVTFPAGTGGTGTATNWGLGTSSSGAGKLLYKGAISPSIVCGNGVTPQLTAGTVVTED